MSRFRPSRRLMSPWLLPLFWAPAALAGGPQVNGKLEKIGPFRVLRVWGTHEEMGFAHGFLLGEELVADLNADWAAKPAEARMAYSQVQAGLISVIRVPEPIMAELQGMLRGIAAASGSAPTLAALGRPLTVDDLVVRNAGDLLRAFGCSGFTIWGERAGKAGIITTRNFDFPLLSPKMLEQQLIVVRQPAGRRQVALITWPCFVGAVTGINEEGVCTFMHDGTGDGLRLPQGKYTPVALAMTELLEGVGPGDAHARFERELRELAPYPFSYMLRVVAPVGPGTGGPPERVFHIDAAGFGENPGGPSQCITTNHYLTDGLRPAATADPWSLKRYQELEGALKRPVTAEAAWDALEAVSISDTGHGTLYSLVVYPRERRLDLAFARLEGGRVTAAPKSEPVSIDFTDLFTTRR